MATISLGIAGAAGRMGRRLIALAAEQPEVFRLAAAIDAAGVAARGKDAGTVGGVGPAGVAIAAALSGDVDVLVDFSAAAATRGLLATCVERRIAMVIGTTGLTAADQELINRAAATIPVLQATNTSLGINVLLAVAAQVARQLGEGYDIEIVEAHHNQKKDAPSGTAMSLAESICAATGRKAERDLIYGRHGVGGGAARVKGTIGVHAVRMGDVVGEHTVYYAAAGERIELRHTATSRDTFVRGALRAAAFLAGKKAGRYSMKDVLGL